MFGLRTNESTNTTYQKSYSKYKSIEKIYNIIIISHDERYIILQDNKLFAEIEQSKLDQSKYTFTICTNIIFYERIDFYYTNNLLYSRNSQISLTKILNREKHLHNLEEKSNKENKMK